LALTTQKPPFPAVLPLVTCSIVASLLIVSLPSNVPRLSASMSQRCRYDVTLARDKRTPRVCGLYCYYFHLSITRSGLSPLAIRIVNQFASNIDCVLGHGQCFVCSNSAIATHSGHAIAQARPRFEPRSCNVKFLVDKVALGQVFSEYFSFPCQF
jgi:hypothetical protein